MPEDTRYGFPRPAWEAAKQEANAFIESRARERRTLTYAELCREVSAITLKPRSWAIVGFLNEICADADARYGILLATLVVRADTGLPGDGYFRNSESLGRDIADRESFWRREAERVWSAYARER
ncbi:MAG: hypothetical protein EG823_08605 [Actinobacteria bacterium]|nr:hypothetical protein [Actinomycetota bacterium]